MAGLTAYAPTAYLDAVLRFGAAGMNFETRMDEYGALRAYIASSPLLLSESDITAAKQSFERPIRIPVIKRMSITLIDGRACVVTGQEPETDYVGITFSTKGFKVAVPTEMLDQNYIRYQELLSTGLYFGWNKWYDYMEATAIAHLEANKSSSLVDVSAYFTQPTGAYYKGRQGRDFYLARNYAMGRNLLGQTGFLNVESPNAQVVRKDLSTKGLYNSQNDVSLIGGTTDFSSYKLLPGSGFAETHYLFAPGSVGVYYWVSPNAANGHVKVPQKDFWYTVKDPMFNYFTASVHYQESCADIANVNGSQSEPVYKDNYEFTIDPSFMKAYSSVVGESPIIKFNLTSETI